MRLNPLAVHVKRQGTTLHAGLQQLLALVMTMLLRIVGMVTDTTLMTLRR